MVFAISLATTWGGWTEGYASLRKRDEEKGREKWVIGKIEVSGASSAQLFILGLIKEEIKEKRNEIERRKSEQIDGGKEKRGERVRDILY